jgi:hypothetical protein
MDLLNLLLMLVVEMAMLVPTAIIASAKNRNVRTWLILGIFFNPISLIIIALLPKLPHSHKMELRSSL